MDDILRTGSKLAELKQLLEARGAKVVGLAVIIYQPTPNTIGFRQSLPLYYLAKLDASYYADAPIASCASAARRWRRSGYSDQKLHYAELLCRLSQNR